MSEQRFSEANRGVSQAATASCKADSSLATDGGLRVEPGVPKRHRLFLLTWYGVNFLLIVAVVAVVYTFTPQLGNILRCNHSGHRTCGRENSIDLELDVEPPRPNSRPFLWANRRLATLSIL